MRLGINLGTGGPGGPADDVQRAVAAERLGYSVCWAAEAYGWDRDLAERTATLRTVSRAAATAGLAA